MLNTNILVVQDDNSRANSNDIIQKIVSIFKNYFLGTNAKIGMSLDITSINNSILTIQGVSTFYTYRPDLNNSYVEGLSLLIQNPIYSSDINVTTQNFNLPIFKFPYFSDVDKLGTKISVARTSDLTNILSANVTATNSSNNGNTNTLENTTQSAY